MHAAWAISRKNQEICVLSQGHVLIAITETWWDSPHDCDAVIDGSLGNAGQQGELVELLCM